MRKLQEIRDREEFKRTLLTFYFTSILTVAMFVITRISEKSVFNLGFFIELGFLIVSLRFYLKAQVNKNYAFWGVVAALFIYIGMHLLHYTFIDHNILVIYLGMLALIFIFLNAYSLSSPLYYPRIQWWEYDFRYRGELKAKLKLETKESDVRLVDLRRQCISITAFDHLHLGEAYSVELQYGQRTFLLDAFLNTAREDIPGRPIRYGLKLNISSEERKRDYLELQKIWNMHKKANIRRKFANYHESQG